MNIAPYTVAVLALPRYARQCHHHRAENQGTDALDVLALRGDVGGPLSDEKRRLGLCSISLGVSCAGDYLGTSALAADSSQTYLKRLWAGSHSHHRV